jgi:hypothetical protein
VEEDDAGRRAVAAVAAPVEEVDPVARIHGHHEACRRVRHAA